MNKKGVYVFGLFNQNEYTNKYNPSLILPKRHLLLRHVKNEHNGCLGIWMLFKHVWDLFMCNQLCLAKRAKYFKVMHNKNQLYYLQACINNLDGHVI